MHHVPFERLQAPPKAPPGFRPHALDGAMLYFQPHSGTHIRVRHAGTLACVRQAPRAVMLGITNVCNLRCGFCSRDAQAPSLWTVDSAFALLHGLHAAGTLEVAFGGGEPLLFKGFADLVRRLQAHTDLALNLTTNGTRVSPELWQSLQGGIRMARLSIYPDTDVPRIARVWQAQGQRWGANVLVDDAALPSLSQLLHQLTALGAQDVSILTYVGEPARLLSPAGRQRLRAIIGQSPLPCRLSVCTGDMGLAAFSAGFVTGDCGAGHDFISITADQRVQACSFAAERWPAATAAQALHAWRTQQNALRLPSPRSGCARHEAPITLHRPPVEKTSVHVWQSFSGNNSGECVMVAQFESAGRAQQWADQLLPGWQPDQPWSQEWLQLLDTAQIARPEVNERGRTYEDMPTHLAPLGRSVIAITHGLGHELAELEHLAWRQQADGVNTLPHVHGDIRLLALARCANAQQAQAVAERLAKADHPDMLIWPRQQHVLVLAQLLNEDPDALPPGPNTLAGRKTQLDQAFAGLPWVCDVVDISTPQPLLQTLKHHRPDVPRHTRLQAHFFGQYAAASVQTLLRQWQDLGPLHWGYSSNLEHYTLVVSAGERPRRLAVLAARAGARLDWTYGQTLEVHAYLQPRRRRGKTGHAPDLQRFAADLQQRLASLPLHREAITLHPPSWPGADTRHLHVRTGRPEAIVPALLAQAQDSGLSCSLHLRDCDPLHWVYDRLMRALSTKT